MSDNSGLWPALPYEQLAPTVDHLNRLVQIAGKYTLDQLFEPGWGNIVYDVSPRGLRTPTLRIGRVTFDVHYRLLDGDVLLEASTGNRVLPLGTTTVAEFYAEFVAAAAALGIPAPGSTIATEIADPVPLDADHVHRPWDPSAARAIWAGFNAIAGPLERWQAPFRGYRPRVGVMWGGFDLSATRYRAESVPPPPDRPAFMQHGMCESYVAVGLSFGSPDSPEAAVYAYIAPQPDGLEGRAWGAESARWVPEAGLIVLPWEGLRCSEDPGQTRLDFADAVYLAAVETAGWPPDLVGERLSGWDASRTPMSG